MLNDASKVYGEINPDKKTANRRPIDKTVGVLISHDMCARKYDVIALNLNLIK